VQEEVVGVIDPRVIDTHSAVQLRATKNFEDIYGKDRKAGEEYLITLDEASLHIIDVFEEFVRTVPLTILNSRQYCLIDNPIDPETQKNRLGASILIRGPVNFFLKPGEELNEGIKDAYLLSEDQALLL
jgi:major vault protein